LILLLKQKVLLNRKKSVPVLQCVRNKLLDFIIFLEKILVIAKLPCYKALHALFIKMMTHWKLLRILSYSASTLRRYVEEILSPKG